MTEPSANQSQHPDPLNSTLHAMRMQGALYCRAELAAPWGIEIPRFSGMLGFVVITAGRCRFEMEGTTARWLEPGSLTLISRGTPHTLRDAPNSPVAPLDALQVTPITEQYEVLRHGGEGEQTRATYGVVRFDSQIAQRFLAHLPEVLVYSGWDKDTDGWMESTLRYVSRKAASYQPGGETVITRLADILIIQTIRAWLETAPEARIGWLAAVRDPRVGRALAAIHSQPEKPWTVATLAREAALSRSAFSERFAQMVGQGAMAYLTDWRMSCAAALLEETDLLVSDIAPRIGYNSEPAFGRAFKRAYGVAPGQRRRALRTK